MLVGFIAFLIGTSAIFFLPNEWWVVIAYAAILILFSLIRKINHRKLWRTLCSILPFVLLTFCFNWWWGDLQKASLVGIKLLLVCSATVIYTQSISLSDLIREVRRKFKSTKIDELTILVCLALSMTAILRRDIAETKTALTAKGVKLDFRTARHIIASLLLSSLRRVERVDEALRAKGIWCDD